MSFNFTDESLKKIEESRKKYPTALAAVMDTLWIAQEQNGYISTEVMQEIANVLGIDNVSVLSAATFYTMYHKKPMGKHHIQVCTNVSCMLRGGYEIWKQIKEKYGIDNLGVTKDGLVSIEEVECMGACGYAPMIAINEDYFENLTKDKVEEILDTLK
ncbi:MAG: NAD(P)H-dependent oxidoreductase subunit E [Ignavibacteriales bacterium]|jgi:NADH-quinone oxidoreductase E subunit|nr:MAG: NAD(P)H-dependent oxidoreductase subunit E [Ignavibacteriales bacterium]